ncbi:MAG: hypothetical protein EBS16_07520 [Betaproteobacteria bacterium]|jgi:molecular chaperone IbpA|nr:hypothetical protein [Betaproteobacteria bacterium]
MNYPFNRDLLLASVGFERLFDAFTEIEKTASSRAATNYPPYNIIKRGEHQYTVELAVAGFKQEELEITSEGNKLSIAGQVRKVQEGEYLHKGIATRDFRHEFTLAETVVVKGADLRDGLLIVQLENVIPEEKKPRKIFIGGTNNPQLVVEERQAA